MPYGKFRGQTHSANQDRNVAIWTEAAHGHIQTASVLSAAKHDLKVAKDANIDARIAFHKEFGISPVDDPKYSEARLLIKSEKIPKNAKQREMVKEYNIQVAKYDRSVGLRTQTPKGKALLKALKDSEEAVLNAKARVREIEARRVA